MRRCSLQTFSKKILSKFLKIQTAIQSHSLITVASNSGLNMLFSFLASILCRDYFFVIDNVTWPCHAYSVTVIGTCATHRLGCGDADTSIYKSSFLSLLVTCIWESFWNPVSNCYLSMHKFLCFSHFTWAYFT